MTKDRVAKLPPPCKPIKFKDWERTIKSNFPDFIFPATVCLSTVAQLLINDITNPFAVILLDVPSAGKTININFFDGLEELTYATDKFSAASFVSHAANVKRDKLAEVDLLPRLQYKVFLIRDFASIFSLREDDLRSNLGVLIRILDGEGFESDSGLHGSRGYTGDYLFMLIGASTPIPPRIWKIMGALGSRLFFLNLNTPDKDEEQLAEQLQGRTCKEKENNCKSATHEFLKTLWNKYPNGVNWDSKKENQDFLKIIARCARLLARLRGVISVWKDNANYLDEGEFTYTKPLIEKPDRLNQLLYNLARAHALIHGRTSIIEDDLKVVIEITLDSADIIRSQLFQSLIEHGGTMTTAEVVSALNCSSPTASKHMHALKWLGICSIEEQEVPMGRPTYKIILRNELKWFLSSECKEIRGA